MCLPGRGTKLPARWPAVRGGRGGGRGCTAVEIELGGEKCRQSSKQKKFGIRRRSVQRCKGSTREKRCPGEEVKAERECEKAKKINKKKHRLRMKGTLNALELKYI